VLSEDRALLRLEAAAGRVHFCGATEQQVLCFNNGRMAVGVSSAKAVRVAHALQQSLEEKPRVWGARLQKGGKAGVGAGGIQRPHTAVHVI